MNQEFKDLISRIKYEYGLTQKEIAEKIGVNSTYISEVISGKHPFSDSLREKIDSNFISVSESAKGANDSGFSGRSCAQLACSTMNEKLRAVYEYLKDASEVRSIADFAAKLKRNRSNVSEIMSGRGVVSEQMASDVAQRFPFINKDYLLRLDCEQMFAGPGNTVNTINHELIRSLLDEIIRLNDHIVWMRSLIDKLSAR